MKTLTKHKQPIFSLKWNRTGTYLLSGSVDKTAIVWDANEGTVKQQFAYHTGMYCVNGNRCIVNEVAAPTLDVDWRDDTSFAMCSTDKTIYVCGVGEDEPLKKFEGHEVDIRDAVVVASERRCLRMR